MSERSQTAEPQSVRDVSAAYLVEPEAITVEDVPPGYKRTEVGVIPEDWEVFTLRELAHIKRGASPRPIADSKWFDAKSEIGWLRISDVAREGKYVKSTDQSLSEAGVARSRLVMPGNVIMSMAATVGRPTINHKPVCIHDGFVVFDKARVSPEFFYYCLLGIEDNWAERGQTGSQVNLNTHLIGTTSIPVPAIKREQQAIATALSDADALIESLDRLIAKKRAIKQAAMQQLLTGQTRLPGFTGEWETKQLGSLGSTYSGLTGKTKADFGTGRSRYITFLNIISNTVLDCSAFEPVAVGLHEVQNTVAKGDLFFNGSSETPEEVGLCAVLEQEVSSVFLNSFCFGFRLLDQTLTNPLYLAYYFRSNEGREVFKGLAQGSTRYNLSKTALMKVTFSLPNLREQTAIASALSDMGAELEALERRRDKARQIKQGMMQELLTGRTRLVEPGHVA